MSNKDALSDLKRGKEEDYFRKKEQESMEKMRRQAESEAERRQMAETTGIIDPEILEDLQELGYTHQTVMLLYMVPLVQMAWIDGQVTQRELQRILEVARSRGIIEVMPAYRQLMDWLNHQPLEEFCQKTLRVIRHILKALPPEEHKGEKHKIVSYCTDIAEASGGVLGFGSKISHVELELLKRIAVELEDEHEGPAN